MVYIIIILNIEEYAESMDDFKKSITLYGPYTMAKTLHSLNILNSKSFSMLSNLQELSNIHLTSLLVEELSQDIRERKKYFAFIHFFKSEPLLINLYYKMLFRSKFIISVGIIVFILGYSCLWKPNI